MKNASRLNLAPSDFYLFKPVVNKLVAVVYESYFQV